MQDFKAGIKLVMRKTDLIKNINKKREKISLFLLIFK